MACSTDQALCTMCVCMAITHDLCPLPLITCRKSAHHSSNTQLSQGSGLGSIVSLEHQASLAELSQTSEFDPLVRSLVFESSQTEAGTEL